MANLKQYIPLTTAGDVITKCFTNENTDPYLINDSVLILTELAHIKPSIGLEFYGELKLQNNDGTLTTENTTFLNSYLKDALAWFTRFEVINELQMNSSSSGIVGNIDEFSSLVSPDELDVYKQDTYRKARIFLKDAIDFLNNIDQDGDYPTYKSNKPCNDDIFKNHGYLFSGESINRND